MASTEHTEEANVEVVRSFHQRVLTEQDLSAAESLLTEDYVEHNAALPDGEIAGREAIVEYWSELFEAFPDLWISEQDVLVEDDTVVTRHVGRGTHRGRFMDLEPTGAEFEIDGIDVYRLEDGKIAEAWINLDMIGMLQQLGAMPEDPT